MSGATPGQAAYEAFHASIGLPVTPESCGDWPGMDSFEQAHWEAAAQAAITARQPQPAPGDASGLLEPLHALAAKWDATAARNQRNGQSLVDQGDEYGSEGLAIAEALGACVVDLRAVLADAPEQPAPELAAAFPAAQAALARVLSWFAEEPEFGPSRRYARATRAQLAHAYKDGGLTVPEELRRFL